MSVRVVAALEIGSSRMRALVGEVFPDQSLNIIGRAEVDSVGIAKGRIQNFRQASDRLGELIERAESGAGVTIDSVYLALAGAHLEGASHPAVTRVRDPSNRVSPRDLQRVDREAKSKELAAGRVYIHFIRNSYRLDGRRVEDPVGMTAEEVGVTYWLLHGGEKAVSEHIHLVNSQSLKVADVIVSSVASACMVASAEEKRAGCLTVDIGAGTTDYALYEHGSIVRTGSIPVGGGHLTNDLTVGLRVLPDAAEELKCERGAAVTEPGDRGETVHLYGDLTIGDKAIDLSSLNRILEVRLEELFELIRDECGESRLREGSSGVLLTGGTSRLAKVDTLAERVLGIPARVASHPDWVAEELQGPESSTVLGVLHYALEAEADRQAAQARRRGPGRVGRFSRFLRSS